MQRRDVGRNVVTTAWRVVNTILPRKTGSSYERIDNEENSSEWQPMSSSPTVGHSEGSIELKKLNKSHEDLHTDAMSAQPSRPPSAYTHQVLLQILSVSLLAFHKVGSDTLIPVFLANAADTRNLQGRAFFRFSGGFGMDTATIGNVLLTQAVVAIIAQIFVVPRIINRFGALRTYRCVLFVFPWMYFFTPFVVKFPSQFSTAALLIDLWIKVFLVALGYVCSAIL